MKKTILLLLTMSVTLGTIAQERLYQSSFGVLFDATDSIAPMKVDYRAIAQKLPLAYSLGMIASRNQGGISASLVYQNTSSHIRNVFFGLRGGMSYLTKDNGQELGLATVGPTIGVENVFFWSFGKTTTPQNSNWVVFLAYEPNFRYSDYGNQQTKQRFIFDTISFGLRMLVK